MASRATRASRNPLPEPPVVQAAGRSSRTPIGTSGGGSRSGAKAPAQVRDDGRCRAVRAGRGMNRDGMEVEVDQESDDDKSGQVGDGDGEDESQSEDGGEGEGGHASEDEGEGEGEEQDGGGSDDSYGEEEELEESADEQEEGEEEEGEEEEEEEEASDEEEAGEEEEESDGMEDEVEDEDGIPMVSSSSGELRFFLVGQPHTDAELEDALPLLSGVAPPRRKAAKEADLVLPVGSTADLLLPPEHHPNLLTIGSFLNCFSRQLELQPPQVGLNELDAALGGCHTTRLAIQVHSALMRLLYEGAGGANALSRSHPALAYSMRRLSPLTWQEALAEMLLKHAGEREEQDDRSPDVARAVQCLCAHEYHELPPCERVLVLRLLTARAMRLSRLRGVLERRAEWIEAHPWDWGAARLLGKLQSWPMYRQLRWEPLGRDGQGRAYWLLHGVLWIQSPPQQESGGPSAQPAFRSQGGEVRRYELLSEVEEVVRILAQAQNLPEQRIHFTLSRLLSAGVLEKERLARLEAEEDMESSPDVEACFPASDAVPGSGIPCCFTGRRNRLAVYDIMRHLEGSAANSSEGKIPGMELCCYLLLHLASQMPGQVLVGGWSDVKAVWENAVKQAKSAQQVAPLLLQLESAVERDAFGRRWTLPPFSPDDILSTLTPKPRGRPPWEATAASANEAAGATSSDRGRAGRGGRGRGGRGRVQDPDSRREDELRKALIEQRARDALKEQRVAREARLAARTRRFSDTSGGETAAVADESAGTTTAGPATAGQQCSLEEVQAVEAGACDTAESQDMENDEPNGRKRSEAEAQDDVSGSGETEALHANKADDCARAEFHAMHVPNPSPAGEALKTLETFAEGAKATGAATAEAPADTGDALSDSETPDLEAVEQITCRSCGGGEDEEHLLMCDGCDKAWHAYCARPELESVPEGDWYCQVCNLQRGLKERLGDVAGSTPVLEELAWPSHSSCELWRVKVGLARTASQLFLHIRELVEALDKARLRPMIEAGLEWQRQEKAAKRARLESVKISASLTSREARDEREVRAVLELVLGKVERQANRAAKQLERSAALEVRLASRHATMAAKEERKQARAAAKAERMRIKAAAKEERCQALLQAQQAVREGKLAAKEERTAARIESEVSKCIERLVKRLEKDREVGDLYCICRKPYNATWFYISCESCQDWFHGKCVKITARAAQDIVEYICDKCTASTGRTTKWKTLRGLDGSRRESSSRTAKSAIAKDVVKGGPSKLSRQGGNSSAYPRVTLVFKIPKGKSQPQLSPEQAKSELEPKYPKVKLVFRIPEEMDWTSPAGMLDVDKEMPPSLPCSPPAVRNYVQPPSPPSSPPSRRAATLCEHESGSMSGGLGGQPNFRLDNSATQAGFTETGCMTPPAPSLCPSTNGLSPQNQQSGGNCTCARVHESRGGHAAGVWQVNSPRACNTPRSTAPPPTLHVFAFPSASPPALPLQPARGSRVEVCLPDDGMEESWYEAEALDVRQGQGHTHFVEVLVAIEGLLSEAEGEEVEARAGRLQVGDGCPTPAAYVACGLADTSCARLQEWHPVSRLRPLPPSSPADFFDHLKPGDLAEIWLHEGWWQVTVMQQQAATAGTPIWEFSFAPFGQLLRVEAPRLRPCWRWHFERRPECRWSVCEKPLQPKSKRPAKRKQSELQPGVKEIEDVEAARRSKELLEQYASGSVVEVQGTEDGFFGSWYSARVMEAKEARSTIKLRVSYEAFREDDGSTWEDWVEIHQVRPLPPQHRIDFLRDLPKGAPLEILFKEGWWEVVFSGLNGSKYSVVAPLYDVHHAVSANQLRPAWQWSTQERKWDVMLNPLGGAPVRLNPLPKPQKAFKSKNH